MTPCSCPCGGLQGEPQCVSCHGQGVLAQGLLAEPVQGLCPACKPWSTAQQTCRIWLTVLHILPLSTVLNPPGTPPVTSGPGQPLSIPTALNTLSLPRHHGLLRATDSSAALGEALGTALCQMQLKTITVPQSSEQAIASPKWAPPDVTVAGPPRFGFCSLIQQDTGKDLNPECL